MRRFFISIIDRAAPAPLSDERPWSQPWPFGLQEPIMTPTDVWLWQDPVWTKQVKVAVSRVRKRTRQFLCTALFGGHELYRARSDTKLFQQCLLCGYCSPACSEFAIRVV